MTIRIVTGFMFFMRKSFKVLRTIIAGIIVDMMHLLRFAKLPSKFLFHDEPVLVNPLSIFSLDLPIYSLSTKRLTSSPSFYKGVVSATHLRFAHIFSPSRFISGFILAFKTLFSRNPLISVFSFVGKRGFTTNSARSMRCNHGLNLTQTM